MLYYFKVHFLQEVSFVFTKFQKIYDEIDDIMNQVNQGILQLPRVNIDSFSWKRIHLPADFTYLIASVAPILTGEDYMINLDFADIMSVCRLDLNTKTCIDGHIEILEIACHNSDTAILKRALKQLPNHFDALLNITGDIDPLGMMNLAEIVQDYVNPNNNILLAARFDENMTNRCSIHVVCYIPDSTSNQ